MIVELRRAFQEMIKAFPGGWDAMAGALGFSRDALENRIYERKGQSVLVETALQMQAFSSTTHFAEAVAALSGGTFVKLPEVDLYNDDLLAKFNQLYAELGKFSGNFNHAIGDGEIDNREAKLLQADSDRVHKLLAELLALAFRVYRRAPSAEAA